MVIIRPARPTDCRGIAEVQVNSYRTAYAGIFPPSYLAAFTVAEQEQDWQNWLADHPNDILLLAVTPEEEVVGYILARAEPNIYPGYDAEILALHVMPAAQHKGIGQALWQKAVADLHELGACSFMLWTVKNNPVRNWYEGLQGKLIAEKSYPADGWEIEEVAYGWNLPIREQ